MPKATYLYLSGHTFPFSGTTAGSYIHFGTPHAKSLLIAFYKDSSVANKLTATRDYYRRLSDRSTWLIRKNANIQVYFNQLCLNNAQIAVGNIWFGSNTLLALPGETTVGMLAKRTGFERRSGLTVNLTNFPNYYRNKGLTNTQWLNAIRQIPVGTTIQSMGLLQRTYERMKIRVWYKNTGSAVAEVQGKKIKVYAKKTETAQSIPRIKVWYLRSQATTPTIPAMGKQIKVWYKNDQQNPALKKICVFTRDNQVSKAETKQIKVWYKDTEAEDIPEIGLAPYVKIITGAIGNWIGGVLGIRHSNRRKRKRRR